MANKYSFSEFVSNVWALVLTKIFYKGARLIRRPVYIRGKSSLQAASGLTIGHACRFDLPGGKNKTLFFGEACEIGDNVHIVAHKLVKIGHNCSFASKVFISDTNHGKYSGDNQSDPGSGPNQRTLVYQPVIIGDRVWLGENVCVLSGVSIGSGTIIGANSVVNKDIPENSIAVGVPARVVKVFSVKKGKWENI